MTAIDFSKYKRFFAFGCSFTTYIWPTWADVISKEIPQSYIYAKIGAGNQYIYQAIVEAIKTHNISKDDLVMVMFSNVTREDRYTKREGWVTPGNLFYQDVYNKSFLERFFCEKGYLMRDLALIEGVGRILQSTHARYELMSIVPINSYSSDNIRMSGVDNVLDLYNDTIRTLHPSVFETVFNNDWNSRINRPKYDVPWQSSIYVDNHPTPLEHVEYITETFPGTIFKKSSLEYATECTSKLVLCKSHSEIIQTFEPILKKPELRL